MIGEQAALPDDQRHSSTLIVDEFHTMPGADYEGILSELSNYGASFILAIQSLARLEALDRDQGRSLRSTVFANLDGLFAFHTSAEDARYLVQELGAEIAEHDLVELGEHQCDAKLSACGERLSTFSVALDPPPPSDPVVRDGLVTRSSARYGHDVRAVDEDLRSALARIELLRGPRVDADKSQQKGKGTASPSKLANDTTSSTKSVRTKNKKGTNEPKPGAAFQATFLDRVHDPAIGEEEQTVLNQRGSDVPSDAAEDGER